MPSSSLMPDSPNLLFTNAGMNQFVPIFLGEVACPYSPGRAADTQKCIRAGGKHNDLDDVGMDTYHHTFFEMLGNWSFGDYFKKDAITWAWELVVESWKFPADRLYATVYSPDKSKGDPSEFDQEAWDLWAERFIAAGLDPRIHIVNGDRKDNFWMMGDTGPCGPCSELHVDLTPQGDTRGALVNKGSSDCIEIWNLVFIQFNANPDGTFSTLPSRHVDTGMGFERVASIIQCTKNFTDFSKPISNYETDIFRPIFDELEKLSGKTYGATLPGSGSTRETLQERVDIAFRVIADHIRTLGFAVADGIQPGNTDRGYVLRRILRRAVRYGRTLGFHDPFFFKLVAVLAHSMGGVFPAIREKQNLVEEVLKREEEAFNKTLDKGISIFENEVASLGATNVSPQISGAFAFRLYDEQGFPIDLTELMARERGMSIDIIGFNALMEEQRSRARASQKKQVIELSQLNNKSYTRFIGYDQRETVACVQEVVMVKENTAVVLDTSVCYAEMGGQVGDTGELSGSGKLWHITDTRKVGNTWLHFIEGDDGPAAGDRLAVEYDLLRRAAIQRHHTATHLLHWALHELVSSDASQQGSFVGPDKLTFDFNCRALTSEEIREVESLVNQRIVENSAVFWNEISYTEVKSRPDIMQLFGDKYGDTVRVVQIGGESGGFNGYSMELCGGTHTRATGEIGLFRILSEAAVAAGVRRIEAIAGLKAYHFAATDTERLKSFAARLNSPLGEVEKKLDTLLAQQKELEKALKAAHQREAGGRAKELLATAETINGIPAIIANLGDADGEAVQAVADALKGLFGGVVLLGGISNGAVSLVASVSPDFISKAQAGKLIQQIAPIVGGKGGGKPENARGGGKDAGRLAEALAKAKTLIG